MANPVEEFLLVKQALGFREALTSPTAKRLGGAAGSALAAGAGAAAFAGAVGATEKLYLAATKSRDFRKMIEANPDLREHQSQDPAGFNRMFTSLRTFAPDFTREPMVAGAYMRNAMLSDEESRGMLGVRAQGELRQQRQGAIPEAAMSGFQKNLDTGKKPIGQTKHVYDPEGDGWKRTEDSESRYA